MRLIDKSIPGWQHEIVGWMLVAGVPLFTAVALFVYLQLGNPADLSSAIWTAAGVTALSVVAGFAAWTRGVFVNRAAKRASAK